MAPSLLASNTHLEEHDLGPEFRALIPTFMDEVDKIGFHLDPETSLFEICDDDRLHETIIPLLENLRFTKVTKFLSFITIY